MNTCIMTWVIVMFQNEYVILDILDFYKQLYHISLIMVHSKDVYQRMMPITSDILIYLSSLPNRFIGTPSLSLY